jgi:BlaI family transcriptional regulator, penicillinase repressor
MQKPTDAEMNVLHILWTNGPSTVREVNDALNEQPPAQRTGRRNGEAQTEVGYTTTLKIMQIMFEKGLLSREEDGRTHRYSALVNEQDTKGVLLQNFMDSTFRGSAMDLVMQALGGHDANRDELEKIKALIAEMEEKQKK